MMDSLLVVIATREIPGLVASHPKVALGLAAGYAFLEWLWPRIKRLPGNSTPDVLINLLKAGVKAAFKKG